jgi:serine protease SohB
VKISTKRIISLKTLCTVCARRWILSRSPGEHWYGVQAQEKGLVDEVGTSDDLLLNLMEGRELVGVRFAQRKRLLDRFTNSAAESADRLLLRWLQRGQKPLL